MRYGLYIVLFWMGLSVLHAQDDVKSPLQLKSWDYQISYGAQRPVGELSDRFGHNLTIGGGIRHRWTKQGFFAGLEGYYLFGRRVKENTTAWLYNEDGYIFGWAPDGGFEVPLLLRERGYYIGGHAGKLLSINERKTNFLRFNIGFGFLRHKIHFVDDSRSLAQLFGDYGKGLDRLTYGWALHEAVAFEHVSPKNRFNYYLALESTQGFTRNRRSYNYDQMQRDNHLRLDILIGLRFGYFFAYYYGDSDELIFY